MSGLMESAEKIVKAFGAVSTLCCGIIDMDDTLTDAFFSPFCQVCSNAQMECNNRIICSQMIIFGCWQSERWGGKYEWLCPAGLTFINTVISKSGEKKLGICAGPLLMTDTKEFQNEDLSRIFDGNVPLEVKAESKKVPFIECSRVTSFADVLYMLASYAMERESIELRIMEQLAKSESEQFYSYTGVKDNTSLSTYPIEAERSLQNFIAQGDRKSAQKVLNEILGNVLFTAGGDFEVIKARVTELVVLLSRAAIEGGADIVQVFGLNHDYLKDINRFKSMDELNNWLANVLIRFTNSVFDFKDVKHSDIILNIIAYIRQNYMRKVSLNDISAAVNFSVSYISRVFKEEMGQSITHFINKVRVDNAKVLLLNKEIPLIEVAYLCGFEDQAYFNKVFKKNTGVSPGKYRDRRGKI